MSSKSQSDDLSLYLRALKYALPAWPLFLLALTGFVIGNAAEVYVVRVFADFIEQWGQTQRPSGEHIVVVVFAAALLRAAGVVCGEYFLSRVSFKVVHEIRTNLFENLLRKPMVYFGARSTGKLVSLFSYSVLQLRDTTTDVTKTLFQDGCKVLILFGAMLYTSWMLSLVFVGIVPIVGYLASKARRRFRDTSVRIQDSMGEINRIATESVEMHLTIRAFEGIQQQTELFTMASGVNRRQLVRLALLKAVNVQSIQFVIATALGCLMALLLIPEITANLTTGDVLFFLSLAGLLAKPVKGLSEINVRLQRGLAAAEEVFGTMDVFPEIDTGQQMVSADRGSLEFREVSFTYPGSGSPTLSNISFKLEPGHVVAIVGKTGSGKTTLFNLISRYYDASKGSILLDGVSIQDYSLAALRNSISRVDQTVQLFNTTIRGNIAYGRLRGIDENRILHSIEEAELMEFVASQPGGLDTAVGDRGSLLSGGERQRVALARAFLRDSPILLLDEATSALDNQTEAAIKKCIYESKGHRLTVIIAHRLETVRKADVIFVLEQGQIVEKGSHDELMQQSGRYASLVLSELE